MSLASLAVQSMAFQERIVFLFLKAIWRARALFIPGAHITRSRLPERFRFRAFESDNFLRHLAA